MGRSSCAAALCLLPVAAAAEVRLEVRGSAQVGVGTVEVRVELTNAGDAASGPVSVEGELRGARDRARLDAPLAAGETRGVDLRFPFAEGLAPGTHPLLLLIEYPQPPPAPEGVAASQRAFLLVAVDGGAEPAVRLSVNEARLEFGGTVVVRVESADGVPHDARVRVATPRGLRALEPEVSVAVPASGRVLARFGLIRAGAPRGSVQGILVVAGVADGPLERTTVAAGLVRVLPDGAWMPRLRYGILALALLLLVAAAVVEARRRGAGGPP